MPEPLRLMTVLAHPDDESLGMGGTLVRAVTEGIATYVVTATRGQSGRYREHRSGSPGHPGPERLGQLREAELRAAARVLGVREVVLLDYVDGALDQADPREAVAKIAAQVRRVRPQVVATFAPDGAYGHPDHIAISQFTTAAMVAAANPGHAPGGLRPHAVAKLYYIAWPEPALAAYQEAFKALTSTVDGVTRAGQPWPEWAITTVIDTRAHWERVWRAVSCYESQIGNYERLAHLSPASHEALWGWQSYYRAFSTVNGGRARETDLFEGLRRAPTAARA